MKKILFAICLGVVVFVSCKKDYTKDNGPSTQTQKVTFKLGFSKSVGSFQTNSLKTTYSTTPDTALSNHIDVIYYMVFDSNGGKVHDITQLSSDASFGSYTDNLQPGTYTVAVAAGKTGLLIYPGILSQQYLFCGVIYPTVSGDYLPGPFDKDAFFNKSTVTVGTTALNQNISLNRIVSKLVVNINDAIPVNTASLQLTLSYYANEYFIGDGSTAVYNTPTKTYSYYAYSYNVANSDWGKTNYQLSTLFLYGSPFTADIGTLTADKVVTNVTGQANKVTLLSGNLFGGAGASNTGSFTTLVDTTWNTPIVKTFP